MIVSASRRTDIPAFFPDWLINRVNAGYVLVRNPMNPSMVSRIPLTPDSVDCFVFWTKNPLPMINRLEELDCAGYHYYFLFSLNGYGERLEERVPPVAQVLDTFRTLSEKIGKEKVIWRYDPVVLSKEMPVSFHFENFKRLATRLQGLTDTCIFSFLDLYNKCKRNLQGLDIILPDTTTMRTLAEFFDTVAGDMGMTLGACAEDLQEWGIGRIKPASCIDGELIGRLLGSSVQLPKDKHQRPLCNCVESVDIGTYNTCGHLCRYCYANSNPTSVKRNLEQHHPESPFLIGGAQEGDVVKIRQLKTPPLRQKKLFRDGADES